MREGLQETPTVVRLGLSGSLQRTRRSTNPIENLNGSVQRHTRNFKRWRGGEMIQRWVSAALLDAERRLRRVRMAGARSRCRALESEREATTAKLLEAECADVDLNDAARKEAVIQAELESLQRASPKPRRHAPVRGMRSRGSAGATRRLGRPRTAKMRSPTFATSPRATCARRVRPSSLNGRSIGIGASARRRC